MKRFFIYVSLFGALMIFGTAFTSCSRKSGCPMNEQAVSKPNRKGTFKKGKSELFDKSTRKKMAKR